MRLCQCFRAIPVVEHDDFMTEGKAYLMKKTPPSPTVADASFDSYDPMLHFRSTGIEAASPAIIPPPKIRRFRQPKRDTTKDPAGVSNTSGDDSEIATTTSTSSVPNKSMPLSIPSVTEQQDFISYDDPPLMDIDDRGEPADRAFMSINGSSKEDFDSLNESTIADAECFSASVLPEDNTAGSDENTEEPRPCLDQEGKSSHEEQTDESDSGASAYYTNDIVPSHVGVSKEGNITPNGGTTNNREIDKESAITKVVAEIDLSVLQDDTLGENLIVEDTEHPPDLIADSDTEDEETDTDSNASDMGMDGDANNNDTSGDARNADNESYVPNDSIAKLEALLDEAFDYVASSEDSYEGKEIPTPEDDINEDTTSSLDDFLSKALDDELEITFESAKEESSAQDEAQYFAEKTTKPATLQRSCGDHVGTGEFEPEVAQGIQLEDVAVSKRSSQNSRAHQQPLDYSMPILTSEESEVSDRPDPICLSSNKHLEHSGDHPTKTVAHGGSLRTQNGATAGVPRILKHPGFYCLSPLVHSTTSLSSRCDITCFMNPRRKGIRGCQQDFNPNLYDCRGPCELCVYFLSDKDKAKLDATGRHFCVMFTTGGCSKRCEAFPRSYDENAARLCRVCYGNSHRKLSDRPMRGRKDFDQMSLR